MREPIEYRLQEWFNSIYKNIINCDIKNPPYNLAFQDNFFFVTKREWLISSMNFDGRVWDFVKYEDINTTKYFALVEKDDNIIIYDVDLSAWTSSVSLTKPKWTYFKFHKLLWVGWDQADTWTATGGSPSTLADSTKSWTPNQYAWYYVYIKWGAWRWQYRYIISNTANTLTVWWFDVTPNTTTEYTIYEDLAENIVISSEDWSYKYDWTSWESFIYDHYDSIASWKWRGWYIQDWDIWYSELWDPLYTKADNILLLSDKNVFRLEPVGDYLLVLSPTKMYVIKEVNDAQWNSTYFVSELQSNIWLYSKDSINTEKWIYLLASDKVFYAMSLSVSWERVIWNLENLSRNIYPMLNNLWDDVYIKTTPDSIKVIDRSDETYEIIFSNSYQWWITNRFKANVNDIEIVDWISYYMWNGYLWVRGWNKDLWEDYDQIIEMITGQQNIFQIKLWNMIKMLFGRTNYRPRWKIEFTWHVGSYKYSKSYSLNKIHYFETISDAIWSSMWEVLMWWELFWWDNQLEWLLSDIGVIKIPETISGNILDIKLTSEDDWSLYFWWFFIWSISHNPYTNDIKNVL